MQERAMTDFGQLKNYAGYIGADPFRRALHFPAVEAALGDVNGRRILDVGCGDGLFPRLLAQRGASVVGYDRSPEKIAEAQAHGDAPRLDVAYVVATAHTFSHGGRFDAATSVMVLQFATSPAELAALFLSASRHLAAGGRFISVVLNPSFQAFGQNFVIRRFTRLDGSRTLTEFLDPASGRVEMAAEVYRYTRDEYEHAARAGGMKPEAWQPLFAAADAAERLGDAFWRPVHEHQPFALFVAQKG
jgi:2-polyprenyl-3-methyl-5-hydroxy-6-metoxy-1,4-benzoquinol methylase